MFQRSPEPLDEDIVCQAPTRVTGSGPLFSRERPAVCGASLRLSDALAASAAALDQLGPGHREADLCRKPIPFAPMAHDAAQTEAPDRPLVDRRSG